MNAYKTVSFGIVSLSILALGILSEGTAHAAPDQDSSDGGGDASASASVSPSGLKTKRSKSAKGEGAADESRWIRRVRPRNHDLFLGVFAGAFLPNGEIELGEVDKVTGSYDSVAPEFGIRMGYYPLRHFGMEGELAGMPARYQDQAAFVYSARLQGVIQPGFWRVTPFAVLGGGVLGVRSGDDAVGDETDAALHVGGGVKMLLTDRMQLRLDVRDVISPRTTDSLVPVHSPEALLTFAVRFGVGPKPAPEPLPEPIADRDADGVPDAEDHCPFDAGDDGQGCPFADSDCDGVTDNVDACPAEAGTGEQGCPPPDDDGDGVLNADDQCPQQAGVAPTGCPIVDSDGDGLMDPDDKCPNEPETANGFQDGDGCPDELPPEVKAFNGVIQGIFFDTGKATIKATSEAVLDNAAKVLTQYPDIRVAIVGHTDDRGNHDRNVELSRKRAESVREYLNGHGVDGSRVTTRGAGPDEPMADNTTKAGRAKNRRIEFKLVQNR